MTKLGKLEALKSETAELVDGIEREIAERLMMKRLIVTVHDHYDEIRLSIWDNETDDNTEAAYYVAGKGWKEKGNFSQERLDYIEGVINGTV